MRLSVVCLWVIAAFVALVPFSYVKAATNMQPDMYVVMFRADWCGPCKIVEPNLAKALNNMHDPGIEYVTIDISSPAVSELSAHKAFDRQIVNQYNEWMGVTGFAAIIDADTKRTLGCVNMMYKTPDMIAHIRNLKTYALANQTPMDFTCPEANH